jgi:alpha-tubulin suppressor-like RCC1 family protein
VTTHTQHWRAGLVAALAAGLTIIGLTVGASSVSAATVTDIAPYIQIARGGADTYALADDNNVYAWGYNTRGQLADGSTANRFTAGAILKGAMAGKVITQIAAGENIAYALTDDGRIYAWGDNFYGQLGDGSTINRLTPVAVDMSAMAGKAITQIAAAAYGAYALADDGSIYGWGYNAYGQLGDGSDTNRYRPVAVDMGAMGGKRITQVAADSTTAYALADDGSIFGWGNNVDGQVGDGSKTDRYTPVAVDTSAMAGKTITQIASGGATAYALADDNSLYAWGSNSYGQVGDGSTIDRLTSVAVDISEMAGRTITEIGAGGGTAYALAADGSLYAWGYNSDGQVGDGPADPNAPGYRSAPVPVATAGTPMQGKKIIAADGDGLTSYALADDGSLYAWGAIYTTSSSASHVAPFAIVQPLRTASATVVAPVTGAPLEGVVSVPPGAHYTASSVVWADGATGNASPGTVYTVSVTLHANAGYFFGTLASGATISGAAAVIQANNGQDVVLTYTFPATEKLGQAALTIIDPGMLRYGDPAFMLATAGGSGTGVVSFSVPANSGVLEVAANGMVRILGPGTETVTAVKAADATYQQESATLSVTVVPAVFASDMTPVVMGTAQVGQTLGAFPATAADAGLSPTPSALTYQWYAGSTAIVGATGSRFVVTPALVGQTISVRVTASLKGFANRAALSRASAAVKPGVLKTQTPQIRGLARMGSTLSVVAGAWTGGAARARLSYQWYASGKKLIGASGATLKVRSGYVGKRISVTVTGTLGGYGTVTRTSAATTTVKR